MFFALKKISISCSRNLSVLIRYNEDFCIVWWNFHFRCVPLEAKASNPTNDTVVNGMKSIKEMLIPIKNLRNRIEKTNVHFVCGRTIWRQFKWCQTFIMFWKTDWCSRRFCWSKFTTSFRLKKILDRSSLNLNSKTKVSLNRQNE